MCFSDDWVFCEMWFGFVFVVIRDFDFEGVGCCGEWFWLGDDFINGELVVDMSFEDCCCVVECVCFEYCGCFEVEFFGWLEYDEYVVLQWLLGEQEGCIDGLGGMDVMFVCVYDVGIF